MPQGPVARPPTLCLELNSRRAWRGSPGGHKWPGWKMKHPRRRRWQKDLPGAGARRLLNTPGSRDPQEEAEPVVPGGQGRGDEASCTLPSPTSWQARRVELNLAGGGVAGCTTVRVWALSAPVFGPGAEEMLDQKQALIWR